MQPDQTIDASRIKDLRKQKKLTLQQMAERLGMTKNGYDYKEKKGTHQVEDLPRYAKALNMRIEELVSALVVDDGGGVVEETSPNYMSSKSFASCKDPFEFQKQLFENRELLDILSRNRITASKTG